MLKPQSNTPSMTRRTAVKTMAGAFAAATTTGSSFSLEGQSTNEFVGNGIRISERVTTFPVGRFLIDVTTNSIRVRHRAQPHRSLWETIASQSFLQIGFGDASFYEHGNPLGTFAVKDLVNSYGSVTSIRSVDRSSEKVLRLHCPVEGLLSVSKVMLTFTAVSPEELRFEVQQDPGTAPRPDRIVLRYASTPEEAFFGFGQQMTYFNQKGKVLPILVQEHGIGRGLPVLTELIDIAYDGAGGTPYLTEAPAPHYITSDLRSLFLENYEYSVFDLSNPEHVEVKLFAGRMTGRILFGNTPLELIEDYSRYSGRMRKLPSWVHNGAIVAAQGGTTKIDPLLNKLQKAGVPLSALWVQDWTGVQKTDAGSQVIWNWELNGCQYRDLDSLVERLNTLNARILVYMNPFLIPKIDCGDCGDCPVPLYEEAQSKGYLVKRDGQVFTYRNSSIRAGMLDLSNPEAFEWAKQLIKRELINKAHASGWMADFGEALPFDAQLCGSADPHQWHNYYPEAWARLHREAIDETGHGDDFLFWNRSAFSRSPRYSTSYWLGDQLQTWDQYDGIKTAVVGMLSGGMSGFSLVHSDVGGFVAGKILGFPIIARTKELLMRWMELNAFTSVFRTHEGLIPAISAQVDSDDETLMHLARFATIYKLLAPYRKLLVLEAETTGAPVVRALFLHYPNDPNVYALRYQFLLGPDMLIAPVVDPGATHVRAYLPSGRWRHLWSDQTFSSNEGAWVEVEAPLGKPGVFIETGSVQGQRFVAELRMNQLI